MTQRTHTRTKTVLAVLVVLVAVSPAVMSVAAKDEKKKDKVTVDRQCTGGFFDKMRCQLVNSVIGTILNIIADFVEGIINAIIDMVVGAPVPRHNGERAILKPPTNEPWKTIYHSWLTMAVPIGLAEWILMVCGVMFSEVYISDQAAELKRRKLKHRTWKVLLGIVGSWAIGATILHIADALAQSIAPTGEQIMSNLFVLAASGQAVVLGAVLMWVLGATIFLFVIILILTRIAVIFVMMWALPILLPLAALDVGPLSAISRPVRGLIDMFIPFAFMTLPIAIVLQVGYLVMEGLNSSLVSVAVLQFSGANSAILLGFWIVAAVSPLFVFRKTGRIAGFAAMMAGSSISRDLDFGSDQEKNPDWHVPPRYDRGPETHDPLDGRDASSHGGFGGEFAGSGDTTQPSMIDAGSQSDPTDAGPSSGTRSTNTGAVGGLGAGDTTSSTTTTASGSAGKTDTGTGTSSPEDTATDRGEPIDDVTQVDHPRDLPTETKFNIGRVTDDGEFKSLSGDPNYTRTGVLNNYSTLNTTRHYQDEKMLVQSQDDSTFYDLDEMTYQDQSYEQMSRDTSDDVLNS